MEVTITGNLIEIVKDDGTEMVINGLNIVDEGAIRWEQYNSVPPASSGNPYLTPTPTKATRYKVVLHFNDNRWEEIYLGDVTNQAGWTDDLTGANTAVADLSAALVVSGGGGGGGVSSVSASAPLSSSGGATPTISISTSGATAGEALVYNGTTITWDTVTATPAGSDTQLQYNDGGSFGASADLIFDGSLQIGAVSDVGQLQLGGATGTAVGTISSNGTMTVEGEDVVVSGGESVELTTNAVSRLKVDVDGAWLVEGAAGTATQYLKSNGPATPPEWADIAAETVSTTAFFYLNSGDIRGTFLNTGIQSGGKDIFGLNGSVTFENAVGWNSGTTRWDVVVGSVPKYYSPDDVADPTLCTTWIAYPGATSPTPSLSVLYGPTVQDALEQVAQGVPILTGNTLWVDAVYGNDSTGLANRQDRPFLTCVAAKDAAVAGDLVSVRPGAYDIDEPISKDGVNWHFDGGATVTMTTDNSVSIFDDTSGPQSFMVSGYGYFERGETSQPLEYANVIHMEQAGSVVVVYCDTIINTANEESIDIGDFGTSAIYHGNGTLTVHARVIEAQSHAYYWEVGPAWINADTIIAHGNASGDGDGVLCRPPEGNADDVFVRAHSIISENKSAVYSSITYSYAPDFRLWVVSEVIAGGIYGIQAASGKVYITAQKISVSQDGANVIGALGIQGNELYVTTQKAGVADTLNTVSALNLVFASATKTRISCQEWSISPITSWSFTGGLFVVTSSDELDFECSDGTIIVPSSITTPIIANSSSSGGGRRVFKNMTLYSTAPTTPEAPVVLTDDLAILQNCIIVTAASVSIDAAAAQTIRCYSSYTNTAVDGNVTVDGLLTVGAYVS